MPGIDYDRLRREIRMEEVLELIGFEPVQRTGAQWYGPCPLHHGSSARSRHFSVNVELGRYTCHKCKSHGHQLELWAAYSKQLIHPASIALCRALKRACPVDPPQVTEPCDVLFERTKEPRTIHRNRDQKRPPVPPITPPRKSPARIVTKAPLITEPTLRLARKTDAATA